MRTQVVIKAPKNHIFQVAVIGGPALSGAAYLLGPVVVYGVCMALFLVATILMAAIRAGRITLSMAVLAIAGGADMVSVLIRLTLVQIATPDEMRGRVSAVNSLFIGSSNELGKFESGLTAHWFRTVPAVVIGGIGTLAIVAIWAWRFPALRRVDRFDDVRPV